MNTCTRICNPDTGFHSIHCPSHRYATCESCQRQRAMTWPERAVR